MGVKAQKEMIGKDKEGVEQYSIQFFDFALDIGQEVNAKEKLDQKDHSQQVNFKQQFGKKVRCSLEEFKFD